MSQKYRALQPAPGISAEGGSRAGPQRPVRPKRGNVSQACENCRLSKVKCDGRHPVCQRCARKDLACSYSRQEQKQRDEAMKARLETLEELFSALQTQSPEEAHRTVQNIRSAGGIGASPHSSSLLSNTSSGSIGASPHSSSAQDQAHGSPPRPRGDATGEAAATRPAGAQHGQQAPHGSGAGSGLPDRSVTAESVALFYDSSGPLFHVFPRPQALALCARIYDPAQAEDHSDSMRADVACAAAIAAVGAQYMNGGIDGDLDRRLYDISRHSFEVVVDQRPFDAIKISVLLAMFNIMTKATTAITYVEIGLSMARMHGVDWPVHPAQKTPALTACKTAWRALMFFSWWVPDRSIAPALLAPEANVRSWLSSTLGYVSGNDMCFGRLPLSSFNAEDPADMYEVVQAEMTKISMLKARILQMQLSVEGQTVLSLDSTMRELQDWYELLPAPLQLASLVEQGTRLPDPVWVSVCHTHLLFLGAIMLLHRRTVFHCMEALKPQAEDSNALLPDRQSLMARSNDGVAAAKHSATILNLLLERGTLYKRCWIVIFQSYTSCTAMLHAVSQKQMHRFPKSDWSSDLEQAKMCLSVLEFCGGLDPAAYRFRERLATIYAKLARHDQPAEGASPALGQDQQRDSYLFNVPEDASDEQKTVSWTLLNLLCKPFTESADRLDAEEDVRRNLVECPYRREHSFYTQLMEQLQWKYESTLPFNWDVHGLVGCAVDGVNNDQQGHRFLGSTQPNFWKAGPGVLRPN